MCIYSPNERQKDKEPRGAVVKGKGETVACQTTAKSKQRTQVPSRWGVRASTKRTRESSLSKTPKWTRKQTLAVGGILKARMTMG
eukprot:689312-Amorphochlora_amoeboformis.AAC.1